jgi:hypothetical protein
MVLHAKIGDLPKNIFYMAFIGYNKPRLPTNQEIVKYTFYKPRHSTKVNGQLCSPEASPLAKRSTAH